jgi:hypothetical protein
MTRRVIVIVVLVLLAVAFYFGFTSYDAKRAGGAGDVYSADSPSKARGASSAAVTSDAPDTPSTRPVDPQTVVYPPAAQQSAQTAAASSDDAATVPSGDTISPNPPNGEVFAGKGRYQLYRQGSITWRLDTNTGRACVIFATDAEWKKPRVYRAGCGER